MKQLLKKLMCISMLTIVNTFALFAQNAFYIQETKLDAGAKQTLSVSLANTDEITGFQFDISLPSGISVNTTLNDDDETIPDISLTERKKSKHQLSCAQQADGSYKVVVLSMSNQTFRDNDGAIVNISVTAASTLTSGSYAVDLKNIHIVPMVDGVQGDRIDQPDYTGYVSVINQSESGDVNAVLKLGTSSLKAGSNQTISVALENNIEVTAFQFDIMLPNGITVNNYVNDDDETVPNIQLTSRKASSHSISCNKREDGRYTIVVLSMKNQAIKGTEGDVVAIDINVPITMSGNYDVVLSNIHIVPLVNGSQGIRIDQPDVTTTITIENEGGGDTPIGANTLTVAPLTLNPGEIGTLNIDMTNEKNICSFQFNIKLPEGISVVKEYNEDDEYVEAINLTSRKKSSHELSFKQTADGGYFLIAFSLSNSTFRDNSGSIVSIKVKADDNLAEGNYGVILSNVIMVTPDEEKISQEDYSGHISISSLDGIDQVDESRSIRVLLQDNGIVVEGTQIGDKLSLVAIDGKVLYNEICKDCTLSIPSHYLCKGINVIEVIRRNKQLINKFIY